jgi:hypothetical protein
MGTPQTQSLAESPNGFEMRLCLSGYNKSILPDRHIDADHHS